MKTRPPFKSLLSPELQARLDAMPEDKRQTFLRALALSLMVRDLPGAPKNQDRS